MSERVSSLQWTSFDAKNGGVWNLTQSHCYDQACDATANNHIVVGSITSHLDQTGTGCARNRED